MLIIQLVSTLAFDRAAFYGNAALSFLVLRTTKQCSSFLRKVLVFRKVFRKRSAFPVIVIHKHAGLLNRGRAILNILRTVF